jgi:hypothetical protein
MRVDILDVLVDLGSDDEALAAAAREADADTIAFAEEILDFNLERAEARLLEIDELLDEFAVRRAAADGAEVARRRRRLID